MEMGIWVGIKQGQNYKARRWVATPLFAYSFPVSRKLFVINAYIGSLGLRFKRGKKKKTWIEVVYRLTEKIWRKTF